MPLGALVVSFTKYYFYKLILNYSKTCLDAHFKFLLYFIWQRVTDEGSLAETGVSYILLFHHILKWCIHLSKFLFCSQ